LSGKGLPLAEYARDKRALLCVMLDVGNEYGIDLPPFLQEYDSMGVRGWGCAKNVILKGIGVKAECDKNLV
jgi:hypothetical protein